LTIQSQRQILIDDNTALRSMSVDDGAVLWERASASEMAMPMLQPLLHTDGQLLLAADPGVVLLHVRYEADKWSSVERWGSNRLKPSFNDFVVHNSHVYGLDDGILTCVDLANGERVWKRGRYGHGQMLLLADQGVLLILSERGEAVLVAASPEGHNELGQFQAIEGKTWNHPVLAHGRLYVRNSEAMATYELGQ
jgi:outer membrane protein assembly factor BamB